MAKRPSVPTQTQFRNSRNGQFTTERAAERKPAEHEKERIKHPERIDED